MLISFFLITLVQLLSGSEGSVPYVPPMVDAELGPIVHESQGDVIWTDDEDVEKFVLKGVKRDADGKPLAFRDTFVEEMAARAFRRYLTKAQNPHIYGRQLLRDPISVHKGVHYSKKDSAFALDLRTRQMKVHGLSNLDMDYIRVIRHIGLRTGKAMVRFRTDLKLTGLYTMKGEVLNFIPISGNGKFEIAIKDCQFLAKGFAGSPSENEKAVVKNLEAQFNYDKVTFDFENLMGGGVVGSTAHMVINTFGESFVEAQKDILLAEMKKVFRQVVSDVL